MQDFAARLVEAGDLLIKGSHAMEDAFRHGPGSAPEYDNLWDEKIYPADISTLGRRLKEIADSLPET